MSRALNRVWENPKALILDNVETAIAEFVNRALMNRPLRPDAILIDLADCSGDTQTACHALRTVIGLKQAPLVALVDTPCSHTKQAIRDAGAELIVDWARIDYEVGAVATLTATNWMYE